jgi:hypothetical protein
MRKSHSDQLTPEASQARAITSGGGKEAARRRLILYERELVAVLSWVRLPYKWAWRMVMALGATVVRERGVVRKEIAWSMALLDDDELVDDCIFW